MKATKNKKNHFGAFLFGWQNRCCGVIFLKPRLAFEMNVTCESFRSKLPQNAESRHRAEDKGRYCFDGQDTNMILI